MKIFHILLFALSAFSWSQRSFGILNEVCPREDSHDLDHGIMFAKFINKKFDLFKFVSSDEKESNQKLACMWTGPGDGSFQVKIPPIDGVTDSVIVLSQNGKATFQFTWQESDNKKLISRCYFFSIQKNEYEGEISLERGQYLDQNGQVAEGQGTPNCGNLLENKKVQKKAMVARTFSISLTNFLDTFNQNESTYGQQEFFKTATDVLDQILPSSGSVGSPEKQLMLELR